MALALLGLMAMMYDTRAEAERRLRQIEFFKHLRSRSSGRRTIRVQRGA
jgi:hypothetical protein